MLVTFKTSAHGNITMFGDVAKSLLLLMGQSGNVPGALMSEDVPQALQQLQDGIKQNNDEEPAPPLDEDDNAPAPVAISVRAKPLVELLEAAIASNESVMWES